jgi:putative transposase
MPRRARSVFAGIPHHVTQRGNRKENVFFGNQDRKLYLRWLSEYCCRHEVEVLAYCLMTNHVHLVMVPSTKDGLKLTLKPLHIRYAQYVNKNQGWNGRLWQGRFFSSPMDESYTWWAIKYVELNPVRAGMVEKAEDYPWSSAAPHCGLRQDNVITSSTIWNRKFKTIENWSNWLSSGIEQETEEQLRAYVRKGLPCGSPSFIQSLEKIVGHSLKVKPLGRPPQLQSKSEDPLL